MKEIPLTQGKFAIVDDEDFEWLNQWKWCTRCVAKDCYYAGRRNIAGGIIYMHRAIMGLKKNDKRQVDHIDHNRLDNQQSNLRICTQQQNAQNMKMHKDCCSGYKGVSRGTKNWVSRICIYGQTIHLGTFKTKEEAAEVYQKAAKQYFGEFVYA